jgi:D-serine deaminase-like pyridoxal phosphate-dependent protein
MNIHSLPTPALLLDEEILEQNLRRMQEKANAFSVKLRPHIKTHKCLEIGKKQLALGAKGITVSTFYEAVEFSKAGFTDITWAFPIPPIYATQAAALAEKITFRVVIDSLEAKGHLDKAARVGGKRTHVWLKVDCGYHRAGVDPKSALAEELVKSLSESKVLEFDGILSHSGHSYDGANREEIKKAADEERAVMVEIAERMRAKHHNIPAVSIGSTPAMSVIKDLTGVSEVRPGNYVFNDYTQAATGVCEVGNCAVTVLASVISHQPGAKHFVTDAGALALSKDVGPLHVANDMEMGSIFEDYDRKRLASHIQLKALSQEHGKVFAGDAKLIEGKYHVGERVRILENHSCLTVYNFDKYYVVKGDELVGEWKILRGRS